MRVDRTLTFSVMYFSSVSQSTNYVYFCRCRFKPVIRECELVRQKAGVIDLTPCGKLELRGRDAARLLDRLTANDLPAVGRAVTTHMLTETGRVYAELTLTRLDDDSFFCVTGAASELRDLRYLLMLAT